MKIRSLPGFTLIELLVVIAIIGILSSVVLGSLALARLKAQDTAIKSDIHTIQLQMELLYDNTKSYGTVPSSPLVANSAVVGSTVFATDTNIKSALQAAIAQGGPAYYGIGTNGNSYAVAVPLKADSANWWCVDNSGRAKTVPAASFTGQALSTGCSSAPVCCP